MKIIHNKNCRMCGGTRFEKVIDFGENPLVNSLLTEKEIGTEETAPLVVYQCQDCHLVQIKEIVDSHQIYQDVDYLYFSSDMPMLSDYFKKFAKDVEERFLEQGDFICEIGSNDGVFLSHLANYRILGIDPALNVVLRALNKGIPTIPEFFTERVAKKIRNEFGEAKLITGSNCIAHLNDLEDLMRGVKTLLTNDGIFVVECNYWGGMVKNKNYALIYHDHFSYFSLQNWVDYAEAKGLKVFDAIVTPAQGGSLRVFMDRGKREMTDRCIELLRREMKTELNTYKTCQRYEKEVKEQARQLGDLINKLKEEGNVIAGYGAAAKGFSVLKLAGIDNNQIDYFIDDSPAKQGKFTPISHIPIYKRESQNPDYFFITAPNYKDVIIEKEIEFRNSGGRFITIDGEII